MPKLIKKTASGWQISADLGEESSGTNWQTLEQWQPGDALFLTGETEPDAHFVQAKAIAIEFPAFIDGRALSLAVLLRTRLNFKGELRAVGAVHEDILHYMVRCGFDAMELPDERNSETAMAALEPYSAAYQGSAIAPEPSYRRVNRGA